MSFIRNVQKILKQNVREYGMYIALLAIIVFFTTMTNGIFISSRNISNLLNQTGYIAVLAVGMTLVIVIRHIDLSVGFFSWLFGSDGRHCHGSMAFAGSGCYSFGHEYGCCCWFDNGLPGGAIRNPLFRCFFGWLVDLPRCIIVGYLKNRDDHHSQ